VKSVEVLATQIRKLSATGDMDKLVDLQNRAVVVEKMKLRN
jgi:hypothetical protein